MSEPRRRGRPAIERVCRHCANAFLIERYRTEGQEGIFCSARCYHASKSKADAETFWANVVPIESGCMEWRGAPLRGGLAYGRLRVRGKAMRAHRYAWELANGQIAPGLFVCHRCDNAACVNPSHLFLGTAADNNRDMVAKGRARYPGARNPLRGDEHPFRKRPELVRRGDHASAAKLTTEKVIELRRRHAAGATYTSLATELGMTDAAVRCAIIGRTWSHVREGLPVRDAEATR